LRKPLVDNVEREQIPCAVEFINTLNQLIGMVARRFVISGIVQGVGYRFFAMRAAARHQALGTVRNLPDGSVEVIAEGDRESIDELKHDLATGPSMAEITGIEETDLPVTGLYRDFRIDH
jgi:acylphosphatase